MRNARDCVICHTTYEYCPNCSKYDGYPRWMSLFCCENCKDIYQVENQYGNGEITKDEAQAKMMKLDLSKRSAFTGCFKELADEILKEDNYNGEDDDDEDESEEDENGEPKIFG